MQRQVGSSDDEVLPAVDCMTALAHAWVQQTENEQ